MKTVKTLAIALLLVCAPLFGGQILVKFDEKADPVTKQEIAQSLRVKRVGSVHKLDVDVYSVDDAAKSNVIKNLQNNPKVKYVEEDGILRSHAYAPNDPSYSSQWHLPNVQANEAWVYTKGSPGVLIGFIDSGADYSHPDLSPNLIRGPSFVTGTPTSDDVYGHGTAASGTSVAVMDNWLGIASVAPNCKAIMVKVLSDDTNYGYYSWFANGITYLADQGVDVINASLGGETPSATMQSAVDYARSRGVIVVASAGNANSSALQYPASLNGVISVSATGQSNGRAGFSSFGTAVDISGPGEAILTTHRGGSYASWSGTSFSAPIVSGVAALIKSANPSLTGTQIETILTSSADDLGAAGWDQYFGWGKVNALRAVQMASGPIPGDTIAPSVPTGLVASNIQPNSFTLRWSASNDNIGVAGYEIFYNGAFVGGTSSLIFGLNTLSPSTTYVATIRAYDAAGNFSNLSQPLSVTTSSGPPPDSVAPVALISSSLSKNIGKITVSASDNVSVTLIELVLDGEIVATSYNSNSLSFSVNKRKLSAGSHSAFGRAYDAAGNVGVTSTIQFSL